MNTDWLEDQALALQLEAGKSTWQSLDERGRWLVGRQVAEWTYALGRPRHGNSLDGILERRWRNPGEVRRFVAQLAAGTRSEELPAGVIMFVASQDRATERQLEPFAACWRQLRSGRPYRIIALSNAELEGLGRAFGEWFAGRCTSMGISPEETARRLQHGSTAGVLQDPRDGEEPEEEEARWFWAARHCKSHAVTDLFRAGMLAASGSR
ncbi:hypothetical protein ACFXKW_28145 [Streptomyces sp. NPDC059193]|uniref:hypothetical protein n=1 Tax=Streptomyces sp. NPDC059193 TaxID=3346763 RepID=UPI0036762041